MNKQSSQPKAVENVEEKIKVKRQKAKAHYDKTAKPLPELVVGQEVRLAPLQKNKAWDSGICLSKFSDRSYLIIENKTVCRNRVFLKPKEQSESDTLEPHAGYSPIHS